jgi:hypothetical protein
VLKSPPRRFYGRQPTVQLVWIGHLVCASPRMPAICIQQLWDIRQVSELDNNEVGLVAIAVRSGNPRLVKTVHTGLSTTTTTTFVVGSS